jgi:hypothetical protein
MPFFSLNDELLTVRTFIFESQSGGQEPTMEDGSNDWMTSCFSSNQKTFSVYPGSLKIPGHSIDPRLQGTLLREVSSVSFDFSEVGPLDPRDNWCIASDYQGVLRPPFDRIREATNLRYQRPLFLKMKGVTQIAMVAAIHEAHSIRDCLITLRGHETFGLRANLPANQVFGTSDTQTLCTNCYPQAKILGPHQLPPDASGWFDVELSKPDVDYRPSERPMRLEIRSTGGTLPVRHVTLVNGRGRFRLLTRDNEVGDVFETHLHWTNGALAGSHSVTIDSI